MRNGTGYYRYASLDDFLQQKAPRDFAVTYGYTGDKNREYPLNIIIKHILVAF